MQINQKKEFIGNLEKVSETKETRKAGRYKSSILVDGRWFVIFDSEERIKKMMEPLTTGDKVKIFYKDSSFNGRESYIATSVTPIKQAVLEMGNKSPSLQIPASQDYAIIEDSRLNIKRLKQTIAVWKADFDWFLKELEKVKE